eukprot:GHUV01028371.1.p1 GENE.GHUV01028371.1~~GHUV01028371.1.p1  ORF type:complete len:153 (-),score=10.34 GHUV01028371.1:546-1004(-)
MVIMQRLLARMRACLQTAWLPQLHLCYIESEGHFCIAALCCYCLESYCFAVVPLYLPLMSAGPIAESYNPFGMMFPKASYVIGAVIRFTLSLRTSSSVYMPNLIEATSRVVTSFCPRSCAILAAYGCVLRQHDGDGTDKFGPERRRCTPLRR